MHDGDSSEVGASRFAIQDVHRFNTDRHAGKCFRLLRFSSAHHALSMYRWRVTCCCRQALMAHIDRIMTLIRHSMTHTPSLHPPRKSSIVSSLVLAQATCWWCGLAAAAAAAAPGAWAASRTRIRSCAPSTTASACPRRWSRPSSSGCTGPRHESRNCRCCADVWTAAVA